MIHRACSIFIFSSPILLVALAFVLVGQFDSAGVMVLALILVSLLLTTKSPPNALIAPSAALKLLAISILPLVFWSTFFWATTSSQSYLTLAFKSLMMIAFPIAICTRWSVIHVIALCELLAMGSLGHRLTAGCEQIMLGGPIWLAESIEVFRALPSNCNHHHILLGKHVNKVVQVFKFGILKIVDLVDFVSTSKLFAVTNQDSVIFVDMPFCRNLHIITLFSIAVFVCMVLAKY